MSGREPHAKSLSGAGAVESALSPVLTVRVRPRAPTITKPLRTGTLQSNSLSVAVEGIAEPGATVTIFADRSFAATFTRTALASDGTFAITLPLPAPGTYRLTATAAIDGAESARSEPPKEIAVGDVTSPTLKVADPADPHRKPVREIHVTAANESGVNFNFRPWVTAIDPSPDGGAGVALDGDRVVCQPLAGAQAPHFPLGSTEVTCTATDHAGNRGSTTFLVVVRMSETPVLRGSKLTAEAQGPLGAIVNYQITATGFLADCSPRGSGVPQSCSAWRPASAGLGVSPSALAMDPATGDFYTAVAGIDKPHLLESTNGGETWQELPSPGVGDISRILVGSGSPPVLIVHSGDQQELRISRDGGQSWLPPLAGIGIAGIAQDPRDTAHMLAWASQGTSPVGLYETRDGGVTWEAADDGLPKNVGIAAVVMDPLNADRMYLSLDLAPGFVDEARLVRLFRRTERGAWRERPIFPFASLFKTKAREIFVASKTGPCPTGIPPPVFAGPVYSCDGGENWQEMQVSTAQFDGFENMVFDRNLPGRIYAANATFVNELFTSSDYGRTWTPLLAVDPIRMARASLVQDRSGVSLYAADLSRGIIRSQDGGQSWSAITTGLPVGPLGVADLAVDPADPAIAYLALGESGVFKTTNGGESWAARNGQLQFVDPAFHAEKILVHPLARNVVFAGALSGNIVFGGPIIGLTWATSSDSATTWTSLVDNTGHSFYTAELATDPLVVGGWLALPSRIEFSPTLRWPTGAGDHPFTGAESIFRLQMVPDAARTVVASLVSTFSGSGRTALFSFRELLEGASPPTFVDTGLLGPTNVTYDASDGEHRLFVSGQALGGIRTCFTAPPSTTSAQGFSLTIGRSWWGTASSRRSSGCTTVSTPSRIHSRPSSSIRPAVARPCTRSAPRTRCGRARTGAGPGGAMTPLPDL